MEDANTFEAWLSKLIADSKVKLNMTDHSLAFIFLREGMAYYLKTLGRGIIK